MTIYALAVEYDGSAYHGWQFQNEVLPTVQRDLEKALSYVADSPISTICAGRTDTGVHARKQIVHFKSDVVRDAKAWTQGSNTQLPKTISVKWASVMPDHFHARHSAISRHYRYFIKNTALRPGIGFSQQTWFRFPLDSQLMHEAGQYLLGENDFEAYRGSGCQSKSSHRNVTALKVERKGDMVIVDIQANAFLLHMVRNIVGVLLEIGQGNKKPQWALEVLQSKDRTKGATTAHPNGLYLFDVEYPNEFTVPALDSDGDAVLMR